MKKRNIIDEWRIHNEHKAWVENQKTKTQSTVYAPTAPPAAKPGAAPKQSGQSGQRNG